MEINPGQGAEPMTSASEGRTAGANPATGAAQRAKLALDAWVKAWNGAASSVSNIFHDPKLIDAIAAEFSWRPDRDARGR